MTFRKPFKAVPIRQSDAYRRKDLIRHRADALRFLTLSAAFGMVAGLVSVGLSPEGRTKMVATVKPVGVMLGVMRQRAPQAGDFWAGCNDARAAGTAPIYAHEPGYREEMDGDGDGIACEPIR